MKKFLFAGFPAKEIYPPAVQNKRRGSLGEPPLSDSPLGVQRQQVALEIKIVMAGIVTNAFPTDCDVRALFLGDDIKPLFSIAVFECLLFSTRYVV